MQSLKPFWKDKIEFPPNSKQLFRCFLPSDQRAVPDCELILRVPEAFTILPEKISAVNDNTVCVYPKHITQNNIERNNKPYREYRLKYEAGQAKPIDIKPGQALIISCEAKGSMLSAPKMELAVQWIAGEGVKEIGTLYVRGKKQVPPMITPIGELQEGHNYVDARYIGWHSVTKFPAGTYPWTKFQAEIAAPEGVCGAVVWIMKWHDQGVTGELCVRKVEVSVKGESSTITAIKPSVRVEDNVEVAGNSHGEYYRINSSGYVTNLQQKILISGEGSIPVDINRYEAPLLTFPIIVGLGDTDERNYTFYYQYAGNDGMYISEEGSIPVIVASNKPKHPKGLEAGIWLAEGPFCNLDGLTQDRYLFPLIESGLNTFYLDLPDIESPRFSKSVEDGRRLIPWLHSRGLKAICFASLLYYPAEKYLHQYPEYSVIAFNNEVSPGKKVCITHMLEEGMSNKYWGSILKFAEAFVRKLCIDGVYWDFEMQSITGEAAKKITWVSRFTCFCERCRDAFSEYYGLERRYEVEEIYEKYAEQWVKFRCRQHSQLWKMLSEAVYKGNPEAEFRIYSGRPSAKTRELYGVDWAYAAVYMRGKAMSLHNTDFNTKDMRVALQNALSVQGRHPDQIPVVMDVWANEIQKYPLIKVMILNSIAIAGGKGYALYGYWELDNQHLTLVKEANEILAEFESFFMYGKQDDNKVCCTGDVLCSSWVREDEWITVVLNKSGNEQRVSLSCSLADNKTAREWDTGVMFEKPENIGITVPAYDAKIIIYK